MDHAWLRERMAARWRSPSVIEGDHRPPHERTGYRAAAVLVPLLERDAGLTVLLTRRTAHLNHHAGQICFPGGMTEPHDINAAQTALRETHEEIGLLPDRVEVLGQLDDYTTGTGFRITPIVGLVHVPFMLALDAFEVEEVFEVPLGFLFDPANVRRDSVQREEGERFYNAIPYREYYIWGATATMLLNLRQSLMESDAA